MKMKSILWSGLTAAGLLAGVLLFATSPMSAPAYANLNPEPPECNCSPGVNLATSGEPVIIRHCQCGILSCAVVVNSGQLQCVR